MGAIGTPGMAAGMMHQPPPLHADQLVEQHPASSSSSSVDHFLDLFSLPSWADLSTSGRGGFPWDYNGAGPAAGGAGAAAASGMVDSSGPAAGSSLTAAHKLFKLAQAPGAAASRLLRGDGTDGAHDRAMESLQCAATTSPDDVVLGSRLAQQLQGGAGVLHDRRSPGFASSSAAAAAAAAMLSPSVGSSESEGSPGLHAAGGRDQSPSTIGGVAGAPAWRQTYVVGAGGGGGGGGMSPPVPPPMNPGQSTNGDAGNVDAFRGKRGRDVEADIARDIARSVTTTGLEGPSPAPPPPPFPAYGVPSGQASLVRTAGQQQAHPQATPPPQVGQTYGAQPASGMQQQQHQAAAPAVAKPRVRARRGQATDPHSIAERLRRERIAERMKSLQELVPNANKTDKASMLDEIIDYVKFLQLQVKVLSMSRLGGTGAVAPLVSDLPPESGSSFTTASLGRTGVTGPPSDGLALTERQVARLMEEDMGSAMQYLQSKGLCLMPISLASAISSNGQRPQTVGSTGLVSSSSERQRSEQSVVVSSSGVPAAADKARATKEGREAGGESKTNLGSADC